MHKCHLIIDSCCDLPPDAVDIEGVSLLKFTYELNGQTFSDDLFQSQTPAKFYEAMRKGGEPTTSQLSMTLLNDMFEGCAREKTPTVYLSFTSGLSGSYDVAMLVRDQIIEKYPDFELYIVDTKLPSIAEGLLVFEALNQFEKGLSAKELAEWAEEARYFVDCEFMVEDLKALKRGGRIPSSVAVAGAALDVKPLLTVDIDGKLQLIGIARGRKKGLKQLADYFQKNVSDSGRGQIVCLGSADAQKDMHKVRDLIEKNDESIVFIESSIGPVIGSHVGPGMVAVAFWGHDKRENLSVAERIAKKVKGGQD